jgi:hypothetical protein
MVGDKFIGWVISGTRIDKLHPYASMIVAQLIREVAPVVAMGAPGKDFGLAKAMQEDVIRFNGSDKGFHVAISENPEKPNWPIRRELTFAQAADLVVTPDTGPGWAVAFEPNKKVMLASHASVENISKHWVNAVSLHADPERVPCWPCHQLHDSMVTCTWNREKTAAACISDIGTQVIVQAVKDQFNGT